MVEPLHGLANILARPPTPPKDTDSGIIDRSPSSTGYLTRLVKQSPNTPDESPSSSGDHFNKYPNKKLKRVDFSPWIDYKPPNKSHKGLWESDQQVRFIPPSKECRSSRSILKSYDAAIQSGRDLLTTHERTFPEMLDDVCRGLASALRSSRLDAYMTLNNCLKTYKDTPDGQAMEEKMTLLADFIRRDLSTDITETGFQDMQLMTQALKLVTTFLWTPNIATMLQDDFCSFLLDRSIDMIGDPNTTKTLVNHYMYLLATQNFRSKIMTNERASRLLGSLQEITTHVKGNGVVGQRLIIYRRLLSQAKPLMVARVYDWVDHLFSGMLSTIREVRSRALILGMEGASTLGSVSQVSRAVQDIFNRRSSEGVIFLELLSSRLNGMVSSKDECLHVPQIWSVVVLFLRSRRSQLEHWEHMKVWLGIIQRCFNSSDSQVKFHASIAWNRFIFAVHPNMATGQSMIKMLRQPILPQLDRKHGGKQSRQAKQVAYSSYCNLLYYAFRPGAAHDQIDKFWHEYVEPILPENIATAKVDTEFASQVLISLLGDNYPKVWNENRANEEGFIKPEELPRLDPKWTRQRAAMVLGIFDSIFASVDWRSVDNEKHYVFQSWRSFTKALGEAGSKEVKISMECMRAVAEIMNSIKRLLLQTHRRNPLAGSNQEPKMLQTVISLVDGAVADLGTIAFTEKRLVQSSQDLYEATETPSSRSLRYHGTLASPIMHLVEMLSVTAQDYEAPRIFKQAVHDLIQISLRGSISRHSKLTILRDMLHLLKTETLAVSAAKLTLWQSIIESLMSSLPLPSVNTSNNSNPQPAGQDYKEIVKILEAGLQQGFSPTQSWPVMMKTIIAQARQEVGAGGIILVIIEPLTLFLAQDHVINHHEVVLQCGSGVFNNVVWPESRKEMEYAHRGFSGIGVTNMKTISANPYNHLYTFINSSLVMAYFNLLVIAPDTIIDYLQGLSFMIVSCPMSLSGILLQRIQQGLALWIEDSNGVLNGPTSASSRVFTSVQELWKVITKSIEKLKRFDTASLSANEVLISASLSSRHKSILNESIDLWNDTFGLSQDIEYSEGLLKKLLRLKEITEITISNFSLKELKHGSASFNFIESQEQSDTIASPQLVKPAPTPDLDPEITSEKPTDPPNHTSSHTQNQQPHGTPEASPPKISKSTPTSRLRHNNSQIEFAAIESSPYDLEALESQFLTTRQKEVKERQQREGAAMFPDLVSSSKQKFRNKNQDLPKLYLCSRHTTEPQNVTEEANSPILPSIDMIIDAFAESSPTPRSSRYSMSDPLRDDGPPSSPPISSYDAKAHRVFNTPASPRNTSQQDLKGTFEQEAPFGGPVWEAQKIEAAKIEKKSRENEQIICSSPRVISAEPIFIASPIRRFEGNDNLFENGIFPSEIDVFMDAHSSPRSPSPAISEAVDQPSHIVEQARYNQQEVLHTVDPMHVRRSSDTEDISREQNNRSTKVQEEKLMNIAYDDDEQISAQIAIDMERALSQATQGSNELSQVSTPTENGNKKRKGICTSPISSTKKRKSGSTVQVVVERGASAILNEEIFDCIVVAPQLTTDTRGDNSIQASKNKQMRESSRIDSTPASSPGLRKRSPHEGTSSTGEDSAYGTPTTPSKRQKCFTDRDEKIASRAKVRRLLSPVSHRRSPRFGQLRGKDAKGINNRGDSASPTASIVDPITTAAGIGVESETTGFVEFLEARDGPDDDTKSEDVEQGLTQRPSHADNATRELTQATALPNKAPIIKRHNRVHPENVDRVPLSEALSPPQKVLDSRTNPHSLVVTCHLGAVTESAIGADRISASHQGTPVTGESILDRLKLMLRDAKHVKLTPGEGRDIMSAWIALGSELNEASNRDPG